MVMPKKKHVLVSVFISCVALALLTPVIAVSSSLKEEAWRRLHKIFSRRESLIGGNGALKEWSAFSERKSLGHRLGAADANTQGIWVSQTLYADDSCSSDQAIISSGAKMGVCGTFKYNATDEIYYAQWECSLDVLNSEVILTETIYNDSDCTVGASPQTSRVFSGSCNDSRVFECLTVDPTSDERDYFSDGMFGELYASKTACDALNETTIVGYLGLQGCVDGSYYDENNVIVFYNADCTGPSVSLPYTVFFPLPDVCLAYNDVLDGDVIESDDFADASQFRDSYLAFDYGEEEDDGDDDFCFHADSVITYKGNPYSYDDFVSGKEPECSIPHSPFSKGVVITTTCNKTVRVTSTHLMVTNQGYQMAYSLKPGDQLFGSLNDNTEKCLVIDVKKEISSQQYFGLNCVHSEVLVSGILASTFGDFHMLPSWFMSYVGGALGTYVSSTLGQYLSEWYFFM